MCTGKGGGARRGEGAVEGADAGICALGRSGAVAVFAVRGQFKHGGSSRLQFICDPRGRVGDVIIKLACRGVGGRGVGRQLIEHLATIARERGWPSIRWITATDNATARRLYDDVAEATHWVTYELKP